MARRKKITACEAKRRLQSQGVSFRADFHALPSSDVRKILSAARAAGYRKRRDAPGSKDLAREVKRSRARCRRSFRHGRCTQVGTVRDGFVDIRIGGRQGYHTWETWKLSDNCPD